MILISISLIISFCRLINFSDLKLLKLKNCLISKDLNIVCYKNIHECDNSRNHSKTKEINYSVDEENHREEKKKLREIFYLFTFVNYAVNFFIVLFFAHIQIINRLLTANPLLYYFCADKIIEYKYKNSKFGRFILIAFISYSILGCVMHPGGYGFA